MTDPLTIVVHGESGVGKSWLADTTPAPRLILDVEGGIRFTPSAKVTWDPRVAPPADAETVVVPVRDLASVQAAYQWLNAGKHPFRSVVIDSLTEMQKRAVDQIAGTSAMKLQDYGELLRKMEGMVRAFRDLTMHPVKPLGCVAYVCGTAEQGQENPVLRPALIGKLAVSLPYYVDVVAYMTAAAGADGAVERTALFAPLGGIVAKDRTGRLGVTMAGPSIPKILQAVYGATPQKEDAE